MDPSQQGLVERQFGARAEAYVASAVHAGGEDLRQMAELARNFGPKTVLDMGCGGGHVAFALAPHASQTVTACDLSADMLTAVEAEAARRGIGNLRTCQSAVEALPFDAASFCLVASRFSAHHWSDLREGLREARRVAKSGALGVFVDVVSPGTPLLDTALQSFELLRDPSHVRNYSVAEWVEALAAAGFVLQAVKPYRISLDFPSWIARMQTPPVRAEAIRSLQDAFPEAVRRHFAITADGGFSLDCALFEVKAP